MSDNLLIALQITLIGMSLVFGVIILLWIVMALLVRLTAQRAKRRSRKPRTAAESINRR